jgi:mRNA interferase MazF
MKSGEERSGGPTFPNPAAPNRVTGDAVNRSRIQTVIVAVITSNTDLADAPGNVLLPANSTGQPRDSVVNVSQLLTLDRGVLTERVGVPPLRLQGSVDGGLRTVLQPWLRTRNTSHRGVNSPGCRLPVKLNSLLRATIRLPGEPGPRLAPCAPTMRKAARRNSRVNDPTTQHNRARASPLV